MSHSDTSMRECIFAFSSFSTECFAFISFPCTPLLSLLTYHLFQIEAKCPSMSAFPATSVTPKMVTSSVLLIFCIYKTVIQPQIMYAAPIWRHKKISDLNKFQNNIIRLIFRHCLSPPIAASEVLLGIPPLDLYGDSLDIKFLIKVTLQSDLVSTAHAEALRVKSTAHNLQCSLNR